MQCTDEGKIVSPEADLLCRRSSRLRFTPHELRRRRPHPFSLHFRFLHFLSHHFIGDGGSSLLQEPCLLLNNVVVCVVFVFLLRMDSRLSIRDQQRLGLFAGGFFSALLRYLSFSGAVEGRAPESASQRGGSVRGGSRASEEQSVLRRRTGGRACRISPISCLCLLIIFFFFFFAPQLRIISFSEPATETVISELRLRFNLRARRVLFPNSGSGSSPPATRDVEERSAIAPRSCERNAPELSSAVAPAHRPPPTGRAVAEQGV